MKIAIYNDQRYIPPVVNGKRSELNETIAAQQLGCDHTDLSIYTYDGDITDISIAKPDGDKLIVLPEDREQRDAELIARGAISEIKDFAAYARSAVTENADEKQLVGWAAKAELARRYKRSEASDIDVLALQVEVEKRGKGETIDDLVDKQLEKAGALSIAVATIDGLESKALEAVDASEESEIPALIEGLKNEAESALAALL